MGYITTNASNEPSDASTDRQGTVGIDPRAGTNFALRPLSDRILISRGLVVNSQYIQCKRHKKFTSDSIINLTENKKNKRQLTIKYKE